MSVEERVELFEMAANSVDAYQDNRVYSYSTKARLLLDAIMTFEDTCDNPLYAISRLERTLKILGDKIQKKQNYQLFIRQIDL